MTSYMPIGLSSAIVNLFEKMWLTGIAPIIMRQMAPNQRRGIQKRVWSERATVDTSRVPRREN